MYIVEIYVYIVTYISSRNLVATIRPSDGKKSPRGLTNSASHATLAKLTIRTHNTSNNSQILNVIENHYTFNEIIIKNTL